MATRKIKTLPIAQVGKFDKILKTSSINKEAKKMAQKERVELKSHAIKKALKIKKYVRN